MEKGGGKVIKHLIPTGGESFDVAELRGNDSSGHERRRAHCSSR